MEKIVIRSASREKNCSFFFTEYIPVIDNFCNAAVKELRDELFSVWVRIRI